MISNKSIAKIVILSIFFFLNSITYSANAQDTKIVSTAFKLEQDYIAVPISVKNSSNIKDFYQPYCNKKPIVVEFFSYACPGCFSAEPYFQEYISSKPSNVEFKRVPVIFNSGWDIVAKMYYTNEKLGLTNQLHSNTFLWVQQQLRERKAITSETIQAFITAMRENDSIGPKIKNKFTVKEYMDILNSTTINRDNMNGMRLFSTYGIASTPSIVVNNKYIITMDKAKSLENAIKIIKQLQSENTAC